MKQMFLFFAVLLMLSFVVSAQVPQKISYQGLLTTSSGSPVQDGSYNLKFEIYNLPSEGTLRYTQTSSGVSVSKGTFSVILGPLPAIFSESLYVAVTALEGSPGISSDITFSPRTELTASPYAFHAAIADTADYVRTGGAGAYLPLAGGNMTGAITSTGDPSITMGKGNFGTGNLNPGAQAIVAGANNKARGDYSVVAGGGGSTAADSNSALGNWSAIGGGIRNVADADDAAIGGGILNTARGIASFIGGGSNNVTSGRAATISGGEGNIASGEWAVIAGGLNNRVRGQRSFVGGGGDYDLDSNAANGGWSVVTGGRRNIATANYSAINGGRKNTVSGQYSFIGGGNNNSASGDSSVISGGTNNITSNLNAFVGGGSNNSATGNYSAIGGGIQNSASGIASVLDGGEYNIASGNASTVGGGFYNRARGMWSVVCGGGFMNLADTNSAIGDFSAIVGGYNNIANGSSAFIGGGSHNRANGLYPTIGGGQYNAASNEYATVGGGINNNATGRFAVVAGGGYYDPLERNLASGDFSAIAGGFSNTASAWLSTVAGGSYNTAAGSSSFAAGRRAKANHNGAFVWADQTDADFASERADQFRVRANGGARFDVNNSRWVNIYDDATDVIKVSNGAHLTIGGTWTNSSDRNLKENFMPVNGKEILSKLSQLPISTWNYKSESKDVRHIGPMAQDFYSSFGLGNDDKSISTIDPSGIALAAIQELYKQNQTLTTRVAELEALVKSLVAEKTEAGDKSLGELR